MSIVIRNLQKAAVINLWLVRKDLFTLRNTMGLQAFDVGLIFVTQKRMKRMNLKYREQDSSTDILSFPFSQTLQEEESNPEERNLGDIFLCPETIITKYNIAEHEFRKVLVPLLTHGLLHLCGYIHESDAQYKRMNEKEVEILKLFSKKTKKYFYPL